MDERTIACEFKLRPSGPAAAGRVETPDEETGVMSELKPCLPTGRLRPPKEQAGGVGIDASGAAAGCRVETPGEETGVVPELAGTASGTQDSRKP